ncbi:gephyrin-like molybdotransferase receptor GlpR [Streptomyces sp. NPDC012474]|uniref:divisome protein SepX/GlpR n=1 Tax=Streptomyces sp. NPDC012474 TaxID=3364836 RepID=UPI0036E29999
MSSSGLIYAVIVGAWAAYLVPMWLRRQDELNEARPTERFSTAIRLLSGRAGMERRYAKDRARSTDEGEQGADDLDAATDSVDVRAFAVSKTRPQTQAPVPSPGTEQPARPAAPEPQARQSPAPHAAMSGRPRERVPAARRSASAQANEAAAARARRSKVLARRRRTTTMLFAAFTLGAIVAAVGGLAFLWAPGVPAVMLSVYIAYLRSQERRRFAYQMDRRMAEAAAQRLRERSRQPRRRAPADESDDPEEGPEPVTDPGLSALAADRRALVEQTDHAEWVDQQRERQRRPCQGGDSWEPVPVPLPTYVTAPVAPRATSDVDLGAPDTWSSARSSSVTPNAETESAADRPGEPQPPAQDTDDDGDGDGRSDARRAASARRARERGRTPLFDQYEDGDRPRAANE